jgi:hypothetical protein
MPVARNLAWVLGHKDHRGDDCLIFPFGISSSGYGLIYVDFRRVHAHRYMCELVHGPAPTPGHQAAHSCGNTKCVNPSHLSWKTPSANQLDRHKHGTIGSRYRLTPDQVAEVRRLNGRERRVDTAKRFGVSPTAIWHIQTGKTWKLGTYVHAGLPTRRAREYAESVAKEFALPCAKGEK